MKNEKFRTDVPSTNSQGLHEVIPSIMNKNNDTPLDIKDNNLTPIIGRSPCIARSELLQSRLNWGERAVIAIPIERNRNGSHNIALNMDFDLPACIVKTSEEGDK